MWIEREFSKKNIIKDIILAIILFVIYGIIKIGFTINIEILLLFFAYIIVISIGLTIRSYIFMKYRTDRKK